MPSPQDSYNRYLLWQTPEYNQMFKYKFIGQIHERTRDANCLFDAAMMATFLGKVIGLVPDYESFKLV